MHFKYSNNINNQKNTCRGQTSAKRLIYPHIVTSTGSIVYIGSNRLHNIVVELIKETTKHKNTLKKQSPTVTSLFLSEVLIQITVRV